MDGIDIPQLSLVGIAVVVILLLDAAVMLRVLTSRAVMSAKLLWIALVLLLPLIGAILWFVFGAEQAERDLIER